jgi:hypothetical protein
MKKVVLLLLIVPVAFFSCKKSDSASSGSPVVTVTPSATKAFGGSQISFAVKMISNNNLTTVVVTQSVGGGTATQAYKYDLTSKNLTTYADTEKYTAPGGVTGPVTFTWTVTDSKNKTSTATATITVSSPVSVAVSPATVHAKAGDQLSFVVDMNSTNNLGNIVLTQAMAGGAVTQIYNFNISSKNATTFSLTSPYTVPSGSTFPITLTWIVTDSKANTNTATATINP